MKLVEIIYQVTRKLPQEELFGLRSQMCRAAVSLPSNIAEGYRRGSRKEYAQFLRNAYGSGSELETQLEIMKRVYKSNQELATQATSLLEEILKMLNTIISKLRTTP